MQPLQLDYSAQRLHGNIALPESKSLINRGQILAACYPNIRVAQKSEAQDVLVLQNALATKTGEIHLGAAGTALRFATAYFAATPGAKVVLTGTERLKNRPIAPVVAALQQLGADIKYLEKEGFAPIAICGKTLRGGSVQLEASTSSQFITALMLVAPTFADGLNIILTGDVVSRPYLKMTSELMNQLGFSVDFSADKINIKNTTTITEKTYQPEADWSAAAYYFALVALVDDAEIFLENLHQNSLQGDARLVQIFEELGVKSTFTETGVLLSHRQAMRPANLVFNLKDCPDLAQPLAVFCAISGHGVSLRGLSTLKIKETDRLQALANELAKIGVAATISPNSLSFAPTQIAAPTMHLETYQDHRMAMSMALVATKFPIQIQNPEVVAKSYPNFWADLAQVFG